MTKFIDAEGKPARVGVYIETRDRSGEFPSIAYEHAVIITEINPADSSLVFVDTSGRDTTRLRWSKESHNLLADKAYATSEEIGRVQDQINKLQLMPVVRKIGFLEAYAQQELQS